MIDKKEIEHHIKEAKKLITQGRFSIQEVNEKLGFLMSDLWIVLDRMREISLQINSEIQDSMNDRGQMQQRIAGIDTDEKKHGLYCDNCGELRSTLLVTKKSAMVSSGICADCQMMLAQDPLPSKEVNQYATPKLNKNPTKAIDWITSADAYINEKLLYLRTEEYDKKVPEFKSPMYNRMQQPIMEMVGKFNKDISFERLRLEALYNPDDYDFWESPLTLRTDNDEFQFTKRIGATRKEIICETCKLPIDCDPSTVTETGYCYCTHKIDPCT